jgi:hypothetical protein
MTVIASERYLVHLRLEDCSFEIGLSYDIVFCSKVHSGGIEFCEIVRIT